MRTSTLHQSTDTWTNTASEIEFQMLNIVTTSENHEGIWIIGETADRSHICQQPATHYTKIQARFRHSGQRGFEGQ